MADQTQDAKGWVQLAAQWGFAASCAGFLIWFFCFKMFLPMQEVHTKLIDKVSQVNEKNAETMKVQAENSRTQTAILERIDGRIERMPSFAPLTAGTK